jgi:manganese/zinc/iron transport system ATP- binding protein
VVPGAPALEARGLSSGYPGSAEPALRDVSLRVPVGARVALVGHNGAGKSTLLKAAAGLLPVLSGELRVYGQPVGACHHRVAYLPQRGEIDWRFPVTVERLVLTGRYVHLGWLRRPGRRDREIAAEALERMGLAGLADRQIGQLSGGQQQRALLARALAQDADLLLLDEPLTAVDAQTRDAVSGVLADLQAQGKTAVVATHDLGRLEAEFDGALYLSEGREVTPPPGAFRGMPVGEGV